MAVHHYDRPSLLQLYWELARVLGRAPEVADLNEAHRLWPGRYPSLATWFRYWRLKELQARLPAWREGGRLVRRCAVCLRKFHPQNGRIRCCSRKCSYLYRDRRRSRIRAREGRCLKCGAGQRRPGSNYCEACLAYWRTRKRRRKLS